MCLRCGLEDHFIVNFLKPDTSDKKVHWSTEKPKFCAYRWKKIENSTDESLSQKIYASMQHMSTNEESTGKDFGDSLKLTNWILDSGASFHMTPEISDFIPR